MAGDAGAKQEHLIGGACVIEADGSGRRQPQPLAQMALALADGAAVERQGTEVHGRADIALAVVVGAFPARCVYQAAGAVEVKAHLRGGGRYGERGPVEDVGVAHGSSWGEGDGFLPP